MKVYFDTETVGFHGPIVLIQYQVEDNPIILHNVWREPARKTIELIEFFCENTVIGFNLSFDWFHICQTYTTLLLLDPDKPPQVDLYAYAEKEARDGPCLKPAGCFDIMLHARKGPYQSLMDRSEVRIKRIPSILAEEVSRELSARIPLKDVYFARRKDKSQRWKVVDTDGDDEAFKDVVLKFAPSSALKALAADALGLDDVSLFKEISEDLPKPIENGFAPYALAPIRGKSGNLLFPSDKAWYGKWPSIIASHIVFWDNPKAREYAINDVVYTRKLYDYFNRPEPNDVDSTLACMVGAARWKGFKVDIKGIMVLHKQVKELRRKIHVHHNFDSPHVCKEYLREVMSDTEQMALMQNGKETTKSTVLEELAKWKKAEVCEACYGEGCDKCEDGLVQSDIPHPVAERAELILKYRRAGKELELYEKIILADRLHASFIVIGTLSSRMSGGGGGLNSQGIKRSPHIREKFILHFDDEQLDGGDFDSFEISIADAVYKDEKLHGLIIIGKKVHALFGTKLFKPMTYEEILETKGLEGDKDKYLRSKNGVFAMLYGGEAHTLQTRVGVSKERAEGAFHDWCAEFKQWGEARRRIYNKFCSMRQPNGIGTRVEWHDPEDYVESLLGFRRYFTLENTICKTLFQLAEKPPKHWLKYQFKVIRRQDRGEQTASGAIRSALFAAAFAIQSANMRAAANHEIQSTGGQITKECQAEIWSLQPAGVHPWYVRPLNVHDELMCVVHPDYSNRVKDKVDAFVKRYREIVPLISLEWKQGLKTWADK